MTLSPTPVRHRCRPTPYPPIPAPQSERAWLHGDNGKDWRVLEEHVAAAQRDGSKIRRSTRELRSYRTQFMRTDARVEESAQSSSLHTQSLAVAAELEVGRSCSCSNAPDLCPSARLLTRPPPIARPQFAPPNRSTDFPVHLSHNRTRPLRTAAHGCAPAPLALAVAGGSGSTRPSWYLA